jgi:predicted nuclease of restriction endonuclease-like (RecB) superfamily
MVKDDRAAYGRQIIATLSKTLTLEYGRGWRKRLLWDCMKFVDLFPDEQIVLSLTAQLSWTHLQRLLGVENPLKREFYIEMCRYEKWSTRQLTERINSQLYERTAISKKPEETIRHDLEALRKEKKLSPDLVFRDPYLLDFLGLADTYSENDLESAILAELQRFLVELGTDFAFLARQKRITIDHQDYSMDLLFYHRRLKCLVVIDLKIGEFEASHKGQMELYLRYLEKYEHVDGEYPPLGLILCAGKNSEHIELLQLDQSNIRVAEYLTALPPREVLQAKLHRAVELARLRLERDMPDTEE